jgi:uncharacterized protein YuzE
MARIQLLSLAAAGLLALPACLHEVGGPDDFADEKGGATKEGAEAWSSNDSPSLFNANLKYALSELPSQGEAQMIPWASSYWPTYQDSINYKWDGASSDAASTKYGKAFNVTGVEDAVSRFRGIDSNTSRKTCKATSECKADLGEECSIRAGKTEGRCVPTWFGICHAWAPASILTPEPKHAVTKNGVTFKVNDIKALVTLVHDGVENKFVSLRCEKDDRTGATNAVELDENGRPKDIACRDSNAGSFHVLITNYLGVERASFVFDQTFDDEVWNQPLRGYKVVEQRDVTEAEAIRLLGVTGTGGTSKTLTADIPQGQFKHFDPIAVKAGTPFKAVMTGTGDGDLYVKFGAQPTEQSYDCRPYADGSAETCELTVPANATQAFVSVHGYTASNVSVAVTTGGSAPTAYPFNSKAKKLVYFKTDVQYIGESSPEEDGPLASHIDRYTSTNRYEYIVELDEQGKIIGGEWVGASKRSHPDFAWLPIRVRAESVASGKIRYADVKALLDASVADENGPPPSPSSEKTVKEAGVVAKGDFKIFGPYKVAAGKTLTATMTGTGDADLYVRKGAAPNISTFDCRPYKDGSNETCTVAGGGDVYVAVNGYATSSNYDLTIVYTEGGGAPPPPPPPPPTTSHINTSGNVALNAYAYFTIPVVAGKMIVVKTTAPKDIDLYLQMEVDPTAENNIAQAFTSSGNETIRFVPSTSGTLHIGVHGYEASSFTLVTSDN